MFRRLFMSVFMAFALFAAFAGQREYEVLVHKTADWSVSRLMHVADSLAGKGDSDKAMVLYMMVASRPGESVSDNEKTVQVEARLRIGDIHYAKGNYFNALKMYVDGQKLSDRLPGRPSMELLYKNMGNVYNVFHDYDMGIYFYRKGLKEAREKNDVETEYKLMQNIAVTSIRLGDFQEARNLYERIRRLEHPQTDKGRYVDRYILALILNGEGHQGESIRQFQSLASFARSKHLPPQYECDVYEEIAGIYKERGDSAKAVNYLEKLERGAESTGILHLYVDAMDTLYSLYELMGKTAEALKIRERCRQVRDSVFNRSRFDTARKQQFLYEMDRTEKLISDLNARQLENASVIGRQRLVMVLSFAGITVAILLLYYFYSQKKRLMRSYRTLYVLNRELAVTHRDSKKAQDRLKERCGRQEVEIADLKRLLQTAADEAGRDTGGLNSMTAGTMDVEDAADDSKYRNSNLRDERRDSLAEAIAEIMDNSDQFTSPDFSLGFLAERLESNVKYVSQVINEVYNKNFSTFVNEYRIRLACERLADPDKYGGYTIRGIGESVGFRSYTSFTSVFKKITGISPSMYQKLSREKVCHGS